MQKPASPQVPARPDVNLAGCRRASCGFYRPSCCARRLFPGAGERESGRCMLLFFPHACRTSRRRSKHPGDELLHARDPDAQGRPTADGRNDVLLGRDRKDLFLRIPRQTGLGRFHDAAPRPDDPYGRGRSVVRYSSAGPHDPRKKRTSAVPAGIYRPLGEAAGLPALADAALPWRDPVQSSVAPAMVGAIRIRQTDPGSHAVRRDHVHRPARSASRGTAGAIRTSRGPALARAMM